MKRIRRAAVAVAGAALVVVPATTALAGGGEDDGYGGWDDDGVRTVAEGLSGPRQLSDYRGDRLVVAESDSGEISSVEPWSGDVKTLLDGLLNPQGVDYDDGLLFVALGAAPEEEPEPTDTATPTATGSDTATSTATGSETETGTSTATSTATGSETETGTSTATASETETATGTTVTGTTATETTATETETTATETTATETTATETTATETTATETTATETTATETTATETTTASPAEPCTTMPSETPGEDPVSSALVIAKPGGEVMQTIDLLAHELTCNPDGQPQEGPDGTPAEDILSNPFAVLAQLDRILVADAGANTVLSIDRHTGEVRSFFVPERVSQDDVPACADAQVNPGVTGCDPVPTGITEGPDGNLYVSTLGAEVPGAARVYVLDQSGKEIDRIEGLTSATGVEVDRRGRVYVSNLFANAPEGEPPAGFDPTPVGEVRRIDRDGNVSVAKVTLPTGLLIEDGKLYASAWSIAGLLGLEDRGEVVKVDRGAFVPVEDEAPTPTESSTPTDTTSASPTDTTSASPTGTTSTSTTTTSAGG